MSDFDRDCNAVLRAAYQISGFTGSSVSLEQIINVTSIEMEELRKIVSALRGRELVKESAEHGVELTPEGLTYAAGLPPISEPPLFQDI
jgi:RIO-like serine/threonine protein kinase